jgi:metal-sulfur cluster biosynthetic enzyme
MTAAPIDFDGPESLRKPLQAALARVVDPELALSITDLGLVYRLQVDEACARVRMTMTSPACPVIDLIVEDVETELDRILPAGCAITVEVCWEPAWTPDRMSERARRFLQG